MAACGAHGKHPQNIERDLHRKVAKSCPMNVELYQASVPILGKDEEGVRLETYDVALPHEMFAALYEKKPMFMETFVANCPKHVAEYWQNARGQAWFEGHPHKN